MLVASTEHYGAVLNRDFDFRPYLDELKAAGLNYTRVFSGVYSEPWGEPFNTLNPPRGRLLAPWARSATPGYADGGNKFDLEKWDDAYFQRLRDFIAEAGQARRGRRADALLQLVRRQPVAPLARSTPGTTSTAWATGTASRSTASGAATCSSTRRRWCGRSSRR